MTATRVLLVIPADKERKRETEGSVKVASSEGGDDDEAVIKEREKQDKLRGIISVCIYQGY